MYIKCDVDLHLTLIDSAQAFHWICDGQRYLGHAGESEALILPGQDGFEVISPLDDERFWRDYFDLGRDYCALKPICECDPYLKQSYEALHGLHVLNQPVWDTLVTFIISANNNVKRIRALVNKLCGALGEHRMLDGCEISLFPTPEALANAPLDLLRGMGMGYRAPYLIETARAVTDGFDLNELRTLPYDKAFKRVQQLKGVGPKVADCVLLFGCRHAEAFPVDVWMERAMQNYMPGCTNRAELKRCAQRQWGDDAGILQQYLFHASRMGIISTDSAK